MLLLFNFWLKYKTNFRYPLSLDFGKHKEIYSYRINEINPKKVKEITKSQKGELVFDELRYSKKALFDQLNDQLGKGKDYTNDRIRAESDYMKDYTKPVYLLADSQLLFGQSESESLLDKPIRSFAKSSLKAAIAQTPESIASAHK